MFLTRSTPTPLTAPDDFVLFVRVKEGRIVRRFGTQRNFGYMFEPGTAKDKPSAHIWDTETIHAITRRELARFGREYMHELTPDGGLVEVKREDWEAQQKERKAAAQAKKDEIALIHQSYEAHARSHLGDETVEAALRAGSGKILTDEEALSWAAEQKSQAGDAS